ncbi:hypothetical protein AAK894_14005 [Lachnospiraceae bacterium 46-61]
MKNIKKIKKTIAICSAFVTLATSVAYAAPYGFCLASVKQFDVDKRSGYSYRIEYDTATYERSAGKEDVANIYNKAIIYDENGLVLKTDETTLHNQTSVSHEGSFTEDFWENGCISTSGKLTIKCASISRVRYSDNTLSTDDDEISRIIDVPKSTLVKSESFVEKDKYTENIALNNGLDLLRLDKVDINTLVNESKYLSYKDGWFNYILDEVEEGEILPDHVYIDLENKKMYVISISDNTIFEYDKIDAEE